LPLQDCTEALVQLPVILLSTFAIRPVNSNM
jgi:hypothetical protein